MQIKARPSLTTDPGGREPAAGHVHEISVPGDISTGGRNGPAKILDQ